MTTNPPICIVSVTFQQHQTYQLQQFIYGLLSQSTQEYKSIIFHDGPSTDGSKEFMESICKDHPHIKYLESESREHNPPDNGWGHFNRARGLALVDTEWVWFQNCDNQIVPKAIQILNEVISGNVDSDAIMWPIPHNYFGYKEFLQGFSNCCIDLSQFIVKTKLAQETGFNHRLFYADGLFVEDLKAKKPEMKLLKLDCQISCHN